MNVQYIVKRAVIIIASVSTAVACFGQGQINFFTFNAQNANLGHVYLDAAKTTGLDGSYLGQLLGGATATSLSPIGSPTAFLSGAGAGIVNSGIIAITGTNPGDTYFYAMAAWSNTYSTYAAALAALAVTDSRIGGAAPIQVTLGGTGPTGVVPVPTANGFGNFSLAPVPEPSTLVLGLLGAGALLFLRRK